MTEVKLIRKILLLSAEGKSIAQIAGHLGLTYADVTQYLTKLNQLPVQPRKPKRICTLTSDDRKRGYANSRKAYNANRHRRRKLLWRHILNKGNASKIAALAYYLSRGRAKEFSVTIYTPEVGQLYLTALRRIGVPEVAISFVWRHSDESSIPDAWAPLRYLISVSPSSKIHSMRLKVRACSIPSVGKVSSRSLGQSFYLIGRELIDNAGKSGKG